MQMFILPFLLLVTLLGGLWVHDVLYSPSGGKSAKSRITDDIRETIIPSKRDLHLTLQEVTLENEALEQWLDDGGTLNRIIETNKQVKHEKLYK